MVINNQSMSRAKHTIVAGVRQVSDKIESVQEGGNKKKFEEGLFLGAGFLVRISLFSSCGASSKTSSERMADSEYIILAVVDL